MNNFMEKFDKLISDVRDLEKQERELKNKFLESNIESKELREIIRRIITEELSEFNSWFFSAGMCSKESVESLKDMGFRVVERRNSDGTLDGYVVGWGDWTEKELEED